MDETKAGPASPREAAECTPEAVLDELCEPVNPFAAPAGPAAIVIFGASGDLTKRKLVPALYNLMRDGLLGDDVAILGVARSSFDADGFREKLAEDKELAYTTVLSVLQKLEKAGWIKHRTDGRSYIYLPRKSRSDAGRSAVRQFTERMFGGDPLALFEHLLDDDRLTAAELTELRKMIERRRKEGRDE